jgi:hypothetical protein
MKMVTLSIALLLNVGANPIMKYTHTNEHTHTFTIKDGYDWVLEASTNLEDWSTVDSPYTSLKNKDGTSSYIYTRMDKQREFFRLKYEIIKRDLMTIARSSVMDAIANLDPDLDQKVFSSYTSPTDLVRNPNNLLNGREGVTGLVAWNSRTNGKQIGGFAITPQHVVCTLHATYVPGDVVYFVTDDNVLVTRTITHTKGTGFNSFQTDYVVCLLDRPLPATIKPIEIMPADSAKYFDGKSRPTYLYKRVMTVWANQHEESIVAEFKSINWYRNDDPSPNEYTHETNYHAKWQLFTGFSGLNIDEEWKQDPVAGDSGSVPMLVVGNKLVACGLHSDGTIGPWFGQLITINDLKRLIVDVDAKANISTGLTLTEADLTAYNTYE